MKFDNKWSQIILKSRRLRFVSPQIEIGVTWFKNHTTGALSKKEQTNLTLLFSSMKNS